MTMENPKIELAPEDNARLARLYEEIRGRGEDLSLLISQITAKRPLGNTYKIST
jgi:hypothetical protein